MKRLYILLLLLMISTILTAQKIEGSWRLISDNGQNVNEKEVIRIYQDGYFAEIAKKKDSDEFLYALGGEYDTLDYSFTLDFNTQSPELIGKVVDPTVFISDDLTMTVKENSSKQIWEQISNNENDLDGNWVITARKKDGEMNTMTPGDRRTIKLLGGDRFQWVAFNSATKEFFGTGGGKYSAENGIYTENIDVFSRNKNRVGASLRFDYQLKNGEWHHSGNSSKGDPIYEIWSPYAEAYSK